MTPMNHSVASEHYIWSEILYLDPDFENGNGVRARKAKRRKQLMVGLIVIAAVAGLFVLRYVHLIAKLMS